MSAVERGRACQAPAAWPGVTVGGLLQEPPRSAGPGSRASRRQRRPRSPHHRARTCRRPASRSRGSTNTCAPGRVLVFGNSEVRYLESLQSGDRTDTMRKVCEHDEVPCILITGGLRVFGEMIFEAERCNLPVLRTAGAHADRHREGHGDARRQLRRARAAARRPARHPRARRADRRGERHRQERVRAGSHRPRASARRRRHRGSATPRRNDPDRHLSRS